MELNAEMQTGQAANCQTLLRKTVTDEEFQAATKAILKKAQEGNVQAYNALCDRLMGKPGSAPAKSVKPRPPSLPGNIILEVDETDTLA